jgi:hypothetical protein
MVSTFLARKQTVPRLLCWTRLLKRRNRSALVLHMVDRQEWLSLKTRATLRWIAGFSNKNYFVFSTRTVAIGSSA